MAGKDRGKKKRLVLKKETVRALTQNDLRSVGGAQGCPVETWFDGLYDTKCCRPH